MADFFIKHKAKAQQWLLGVTVNARAAFGILRAFYLSRTPAQRALLLGVPAILLVAAVAALSLVQPEKPTALSVAVPTIRLPAPPKPVLQPPPVTASADTPAAPVTAETAAATPATFLLTDILRAQQNAVLQLPAAPNSALTVATPDGLLPKIGPNGELPWQAYARPLPPQAAAVPAGTPRLAIVLLDIGLSERLTAPALDLLPAPVSMVINAFSPRLAEQIATVRANGHEVILDIPAESRFYPEENPGPTALLTRISNDENLKRLRQWLAKGTGALGITISSGTYFVTDARAATPVLNELRLRGLAWLDINHATNATADLAHNLGVSSVTATLRLDTTPSAAAIRAQYQQALALARQQGTALLLARPYPLTISILQELLPQLPEAGIMLVPASALLTTGAEVAPARVVTP